MVSVNPFRLLVQVISISCTPRAFKSVRTPICRPTCQELPSGRLFQTDTKINGLVYNLAVISYLEDDTVHPHYQTNRIKWAVLPVLGGLVYFVYNDGNG